MIHSVPPLDGARKAASVVIAAVLGALSGLGYAGVEASAALRYPFPLDPPLDPHAAWVAAAGLALALALISALLSLWAGRLAPVLAAAAWAAVWGPEAARTAGQPAAWGAAPVLVLLALGLLHPALGLAFGVAGGVAVALVRPTAEGPSAVTAPREGLPDLMLITVDDVRADAGLLGQAPWTDDPLSPELGFTHFTMAISGAPWTLPAFHSLFSGLPVIEHGGGLPVGDGYTVRAPLARSFVSALAEAGYRTSAVVSNPHLRRELRFDRGFSRWLHDDDSREPVLVDEQRYALRERFTGLVSPLRASRDERVLQEALRQLAAPSDGPRFLWVHLLGVHEHNRAPEGEIPGWKPGNTDLEVRRLAYADAVARAGARVRALVAAATGWGVLITSDHGEALGEQGSVGHGHALTDAELAVPLAFRSPSPVGQAAGTVKGALKVGPVATFDAAHTMLGWAGLAQGFPGEDLARARPGPVQVGGVRADAAAFALRSAGGVYQAEAPPKPNETESVDDAVQERLRRLGYTQGSGK